LKRRTLP
jgi:hypothetical protein